MCPRGIWMPVVGGCRLIRAIAGPLLIFLAVHKRKQLLGHRGSSTRLIGAEWITECPFERPSYVVERHRHISVSKLRYRAHLPYQLAARLRLQQHHALQEAPSSLMHSPNYRRTHTAPKYLSRRGPGARRPRALPAMVWRSPTPTTQGRTVAALVGTADDGVANLRGNPALNISELVRGGLGLPTLRGLDFRVGSL